MGDSEPLYLLYIYTKCFTCFSRMVWNCQFTRRTVSNFFLQIQGSFLSG